MVLHDVLLTVHFAAVCAPQRDNETPMHLLGANAAESQRCPGAALTRGGASSATGSDAPHDPMATSDGGGGVRGGTPESSINGEGGG